MRKTAIAVLVLLLAALCIPVRAEQLPLAVVHLRGSGTELGATHGEQLRDNIRILYQKYFGTFFRSDALRKLALNTAGGFEAHVLPHHMDEIRALADKTGLEAREALLGQSFLDLSPMVMCSTISLSASASPDGIARLGRNLDFPGFGIAEDASVLLVFHPENRYAFASVGWPGMIGVLSGMNEHGLVLVNMEVPRMTRLPAAMPYTLLYRSVLEQCRTLEEAIELLASVDRQSSNNLMLMDATGERAVVELTPDRIVVRRAPEDQPLISTNHHRGEDQESAGRCRRYDYLRTTALRDFGQISPDSIRTMLQRVAQGKMTMQSMIFEPENLVIHIAVGVNAAEQTFHSIDLKNYLR